MSLKQVVKRNGSVVPFDILKIAGAIYKTRKDNGLDIKIDQCEEEAWKIVDSLKDREEPVPIEDIQDAIEDYFFTNGEMKIFKSFVFYREKRAAERKTPWKDTDERQDMILGKYLIKGETKKEFLDRISNGNHNLLKIFRSREAIWGGRILYAIGREGNITGSNCFIKGTKVLTETGYKNIENIEVGDKVLTRDGSYQTINATMKNEHKGDLIKLDSLYLNNPIISTPNHEFLTQEGWVEASELSVNKRSSKKSPHFIKFKKLNLEDDKVIEIDLKDALADIIGEEFILEDLDDAKYQPKVKHMNKRTLCFTKSTIKPINKKIVLDKELAYVLGRFSGDGSITKRKNTRHDLYSVFQIVGHEKEKDILDYCANVIEDKFGIEVGRQFTSSGQKTYIIRVDSIALSEFFKKYVGFGFQNKFIHDSLKQFPSYFYGVFDSDGSIDSRSVGSITMNNKDFIYQLKEMADSFGIPAYIGEKVNSVKKYGNYPMLVIPKNSLSLIIDKINKKYDDERIIKCKPTNYGTVRIINGEPYIQLKSKEVIKGNETVYNISVENNHDYVVENLHVHNCYVATAPEDSLKDIYRADYDIARTYSYGGGQGLNLSKLRPRGAKVNNTSNTTPGIMVFAEKYSHTTLNTQQESRRGALMLMLDIDHPDVIDFITSKLDLNKINGANISLAITDDFMKAYKADEFWTMKFETPYEKIEKVVKARDLMSLVSYAAHTMGDPKINVNPNLCCLNN